MSDVHLVQIERRKEFTEDEFWTMVSALDARKWENLLPPQLPLEDLPTRRSKNFVTPIDAPIPDCLSCGACCTFLFAVGVKASDETPPEIVWNISDETGEIVVDSYLQRDAESLYCAALKTNEDGSKPCGIYERRPLTCRNFEAGSDKCHAIRRIYGYEPFLTLREMFDARQILKTKESAPIAADTIRDVKIVKEKDSNNFEIIALMQNGSSRVIHTFDPNREAWRQFQFSGATLKTAIRMIEAQDAPENSD